jgi:hypothetical protein
VRFVVDTWVGREEFFEVGRERKVGLQPRSQEVRSHFRRFVGGEWTLVVNGHVLIQSVREMPPRVYRISIRISDSIAVKMKTNC